MTQSTAQIVPLREEPNASFRRPPGNEEAEQALLGAVLINNEALGRVSAFLRKEHFLLPVHGRIYDAALTVVERGLIANPVTLKPYFENDAALGDIGGAQYLFRLAQAAVSVINAEHFGRVIYDLALRRKLIEVGEDMVNRAYDATVEETAKTQIEDAESELFHLAEDGNTDTGPQPFTQALDLAVRAAEAARKRGAAISGVTTGLTDLDNMLGGLHKSDLLILAGRPGMGKSALATNIAFNAAKALSQRGGESGAAAAIFSLEMSAEQLANRILGEQAEIPSEKLRRGQIDAAHFERLVNASRDIQKYPIFIDDTPALSISALRTRARRLRLTNKIGLIVVDYLQLMRPSGRKAPESRVLEISEITQGLKALAKDLDIPVLALSQLSRAVESREDKRPQLADLRESGTIEQDADVVMFIYR
ncbi:MAG: replicative DNA helicase, partial [Alphaproteobacteria bacterium]|nr:replicative DNA helicase [Alphaproteobacteria bacterium]